MEQVKSRSNGLTPEREELGPPETRPYAKLTMLSAASVTLLGGYFLSRFPDDPRSGLAEILAGFLFGGSALQIWASNAVLAFVFSASAEAPRRGISRIHLHAAQRHPMKESLSAQTNSRFSMPTVYAVRAAVQGPRIPN